ncbi:hypothetical protein Moror_10989 [Moniliophthora roreri MCA 2997]|uniref:Uncharacterized protein n=1 Tax=Moniliophthora roreri (strain MCA 2997) TaxID=1381753 RepID=V2X0F3_MONRO|nr:hypothetical protein Moror_10989 [Moniliophthora roreri MCA 2997]
MWHVAVHFFGRKFAITASSERERADTVTKYLTNMMIRLPRSQQRVSFKRDSGVHWIVAGILLANVVTLLFGETNNLNALFISLGSFSALAISIIPERYWHSMSSRLRAYGRTNVVPTQHTSVKSIVEKSG